MADASLVGASLSLPVFTVLLFWSAFQTYILYSKKLNVYNRHYIHFCVLAASLAGILDAIFSFVGQNEAIALFRELFWYFIDTAYLLALFQWVVVCYGRRGPKILKISFITLDVAIFVVLTVSTVLYWLATRSHSAHEMYIYNTYYAVYSGATILFAVFLSGGFGLYGMRIARKLRARMQDVMINDGDAYAYKVTINAIILSFTNLSGAIAAAVFELVIELYDPNVASVSVIMEHVYQSIMIIELLWMNRPKKRILLYWPVCFAPVLCKQL